MSTTPMMRTISWPAITLAFLATLPPSTGCTRDSGASAGFAIRDSAGVAIAETTLHAFLAAPVRELGQPILDIGVVEGDSAYQLFGVTGARRLADGGIALMNSGSSEIRVYDANGTHRFSAGASGEGPGEFREPLGVWLLPGDSMVTFDERLKRLSVFAPDGRFVRHALLERDALNANPLTVLDDGSFITFDEWYAIPDQGFAMMYMHLVRWAPDGTFADSLGREPLARMGRVGGAAGSFVSRTIFGTRTEVTGNSAHYWVGTAVEPEVRQHATDGALKRIVRWQIEDRTVRPEDVEAYRQDWMEGVADDSRAEMERRFNSMPVEERLPAYFSVFAGRDGRLWVRDFNTPNSPEPAHWTLFDTEGAVVGRFRTPPSFRPFDADDDWILGVTRDEFDVEHVRLYRWR